VRNHIWLTSNLQQVKPLQIWHNEKLHKNIFFSESFLGPTGCFMKTMKKTGGLAEQQEQMK
jgi:hypothetical protein